ncbi:MAG TPA: hypothetical protein VL128_13605 [Candidatus Eisenbacteria bacterium]|nr:hypothetical protein [Candidatus Eisenbacteria bacterium]
MAILHCRSIERRRTARAVVTIEMVVTGLDDTKHKFQFLTKTTSVSANGGVIQLDVPLPVGQKFHMVNEFNRKKAACRIVSVRAGKEGKLLGAFELLCAETHFWGMVFPSAGAKPMKRVFVPKAVVAR